MSNHEYGSHSSGGGGNPNHPVTQATADQWHKLCAMVMFKLGVTKIKLSPRDINTFLESGLANITVRFDDYVNLELVTDEQAAILAKKEGGLPM